MLFKHLLFGIGALSVIVSHVHLILAHGLLALLTGFDLGKELSHDLLTRFVE